MRLLITGVTGQDGWYLAEAALAAGHEVYGLVRGQDNPREPELAQAFPSLRRLRGDLLDASSVDRAVDEARPDAIVNLGAMTFVPLSWQEPELALRIIAGGALNVLNAAVRHGVGRVVQASTSEMFGNRPEGLGHVGADDALNEDSPMLPASPYGTAKLAAHHLCRNYRAAHGLSAVSAIMFNHESPRRPPIFVTRKITQAVADIRAGRRRVLKLGAVGAPRDWGWAPDNAEALLLLAEAPRVARESYVIATGVAATVDAFTRRAFWLAGVRLGEHTEVDPNLERPSEVWALRGDASAIGAEHGWRARHDWRGVCALMVAADLRLAGLAEAAATAESLCAAEALP